MFSPTLWIPPETDYPPQALAQLREKLDRRLMEAAASAGRKVFLTSLAAEDMVISESLWRLGLDVEQVTIDTGMLPPETLDLLTAVYRRFGRRILVAHPDTAAVENFVGEHGRLAMYESVALRRGCCHVRKVEPLARILQGASAWLTGQRRGQAASRSALAFKEKDDARRMLKFNPIFDFSEEDVWAYVRAHDLPVNPLYFRGYRSIGCATCSKAVRIGEDIRAGRWWWEQAAGKECGLHINGGAKHDENS